MWLNEGFTSYVENRIVEALYGKERADMEYVISRNGLMAAIEDMSPEEQALAREYLAAVSACEPKPQTMLNPREQAAGRAILTTWHEQEQLYVALASGRLTWGQFNRMTEALGRRMDRQLRTAMAAAAGS